MHTLRHLAIIMDGNGRWAKHLGRSRLFGHIKGSRQLKKIITEVSRLKIPYLSLYAFSLENWHRPREEVEHLMRILIRFLKKETPTMMGHNIKLNAIGNLSYLPYEARQELLKSLEITSSNTGMVLTLALSYGSRQEILQATKRIALDYKEGNISFDAIDETLISKYLYTHNMPDPDLIIRTSGEKRLSNFLLWQAAYSELYICPKAWPEFSEADLHLALQDYQSRERRFGRTSSQIQLVKEQHEQPI